MRIFNDAVLPVDMLDQTSANAVRSARVMDGLYCLHDETFEVLAAVAWQNSDHQGAVVIEILEVASPRRLPPNVADGGARLLLELLQCASVARGGTGTLELSASGVAPPEFVLEELGFENHFDGVWRRVFAGSRLRAARVLLLAWWNELVP